MKMLPVESSTISAVGYDRANLTMRIRFGSGDTYEYYHVEPETVTDLIFADSVGSYFAKHVRPKYPCKKLERVH